MPQSLKKRAAELERQVKECAEIVKHALQEYRETQRASSGDRSRLLRKRRDVELANAEYLARQKELESLLSRMPRRK